MITSSIDYIVLSWLYIWHIGHMVDLVPLFRDVYMLLTFFSKKIVFTFEI